MIDLSIDSYTGLVDLVKKLQYLMGTLQVEQTLLFGLLAFSSALDNEIALPFFTVISLTPLGYLEWAICGLPGAAMARRLAL